MLPRKHVEKNIFFSLIKFSLPTLHSYLVVAYACIFSIAVFLLFLKDLCLNL